MDNFTVVLFGEAEKGEYQTPYLCHTLPQLVDYFGNPPEDSKGLYYAVQALLFRRDLLFFRVRHEGFSEQDYLLGLSFLERQLYSDLAAICAPGVGDRKLISTFTDVCSRRHGIFITNESDFYDYLMEAS